MDAATPTLRTFWKPFCPPRTGIRWLPLTKNVRLIQQFFISAPAEVLILVQDAFWL